MNVCEFCGREIPRGRLCAKHLAMRVLLPVRYWQKVAQNANKAALDERRDLESEQWWRAEACKALAAERAAVAEEQVTGKVKNWFALISAAPDAPQK